MTTSPESTCATGDLLLTQFLRRLLRGADRAEPSAYGFDEIMVLAPWPPGVLNFFLSIGILKEVEPSSLVWLWECIDPDWVEPIWLPDASKGGRIVGFYRCGHGCGIHEIEAERRREWAASFEGIANAVTSAIGSGDDIEVIPGRVQKIGSIQRDGTFRELFLVRGAGWPDIGQVLAKADRLRSSPAPAVLSLDRLPLPQAWDGIKPAVLSLGEHALIQDGKLSLNLSPLFLQTTIPHSDAAAQQWLTVTQAADLLTTDLPGLTLHQARARVSVSAGRGAFKTNGQSRDRRRIDRDSFASWRLAQRDKDLDAEDADDEE